LNSPVRNTFDRLASEYDDLKLRVIPGYRETQQIALRYAAASSVGRVLELGCGTGEWAARFLDSHPNAEYMAVEFSDKMREIASQRCAMDGRRIRVLSDDLNVSFPAGPFDLVVSFYAIHHVRDKQRLFRSIHDNLSANGRLIYADITIARDPVLEDLFLEGWVAFMRGAGLGEERIGHILADHRENDLPETATWQLAIMKATGFGFAELAWTREKFALFYAKKRKAV
jgi:ubiquinone/menaquinone biosynthesis C-methylase UbiE